ncbi:unnamed protein product, partial [Rotaria sordida]
MALLYTSNCSKIATVRSKEIATDTYDILEKYIKEYGFFLDQEIDRLFKYLTNISSQDELSQYSQNLETRLEQLSTLTEFKRVFECIEGAKKVEYWRRKFNEQYRIMSGVMEEYHVSGRTKEELYSIEDLMNSNDAFEAEQRMENFNRVQHELVNDFTMKDVTEKVNEVRKRLNNLANDILEQNDFRNIENYAKKSPRDLLAKLEKAASYRSAKYSPVISSISEDIRVYFEGAIKNACEASIDKRSAQMLPLQAALRFLPDNSQKLLKSQIDELINKFIEDERAYKRELKGYLEKETTDDSTIQRIGELALQYTEERRHESFEILRDGLIRKLDNHWKNIQDALDKEDTQSATNNMRQIIKYKEYVQNIPE